SEHDYHFRLDHGDLAKDERPARSGLVRLRLAISRRAAAVDVADRNLLTLEAHRDDDVGKQFPGPSDKRESLLVLIGSRGLADEHQIGLEVTRRVHDLRASEL